MRKPTETEADRLMAVKERLMKSIQAEIAAGEISNAEMLALMAHVTGMVLAMQDQRTMTPSQGMEIIVRNIESGNRTAIEQLLESEGAA